MAQSKVNLPPVGTGDTGPIPVAVKKISTGEAVQQVELGTAVEGGALTPIANANPLPVSDAGGSLTVDASALPLPTGASTETTLAAVNTKLGSALPLPTGASTETTLAAVNTKLGSALPLPTGAATETTLAAVNTKLGSALPLPTGAATQTTLAAVAAQLPSALGSHGGLVIEGVASGVAIPVSGSFSGTTDLTATKTVGALNDAAQLTGMNGMSVAQVDVQAVFSATLTFEGRVDGSTWFGIPKGVVTTSVSGLIAASQSTTSAGNWAVPIAGLEGFRVRCSAYSSGSPVISVRASAAPNSVALNQALPTGLNNIGTVNASLNGTNITAGNGVSGTGVPRVTIASDSTGQIALAAGSAAIGSLTAGTALIGKVGIDQTTPGTTNLVASELSTGLTPYSNTALSNTKQAVKASAGKLYGWMVYNPSAADTYIQVWDVASGSVTVGTTAPTYTIQLPAGAAANVMHDKGITHATAITIAATTTPTGSTAPATAAVCSLFYV